MSGNSKTKNAAKSKYAGMVATPLVAKREALDIRVAVNREDLAKLDTTAAGVMEAAAMVTVEAKKIVEALASPQQRLHRRVQIVIEDAEGAQIANSVTDLKASDRLEAAISGSSIVTQTVNTITR